MKATVDGLCVLMIAATMTACDGTVSTPTSPSEHPAVPQPTAATPNRAFHVAEVRLSGVVFEMTSAGRVPIEGVAVLNGEGNSATTDAKGFFSMQPVWVCPCAAQPWVEAGTTFLWVMKDGYADPPGTPASVFESAAGALGTHDVRIDGNTRFDIELVRR